ncbi:MAG: hypothetical protein B7O98_09620 [Zestosphaera tikiterensis]|uniref:Fumarylacetoacetase-like C-terminal domain-containing protein n=1 Tax=Zestosphaera tikiterensis TaxID=1973259 RepID=A0A2R7Y0Z0_9CREN|nr:MAG: hypothetical protein B7O98_09620 [Zestosphaera tikiterensis]
MVVDMRLVMFSPRLKERPRLGVVVGGVIADLTVYYREVFGYEPPSWLYDLGEFLSCGYSRVVVDELIASTSFKVDGVFNYGVDDVVYYPPTSGGQRVFCAAVNYRSHAEETKTPIPSKPYIFMKPRTALVGHKQPIIAPKVSELVDYEVELGVIIGRKGKYLSKEGAREVIAGYTVFNDISFRDWQFPPQGSLGLDWLHGKGMDSSTPAGPYLVTKDEVPDINDLELRLTVNNELRQNSTTHDMIFSVEELISYISQGLALLPGDLIATGTPAGVGHVRRTYLKEGDVVIAEISKVGRLENTVIKER